MAVPKRKTSKSRRNKRRAQWKTTAPTLVECSQCGEYKAPHMACLNCGFYKGREVVKVEKK